MSPLLFVGLVEAEDAEEGCGVHNLVPVWKVAEAAGAEPLREEESVCKSSDDEGEVHEMHPILAAATVDANANYARRHHYPSREKEYSEREEPMLWIPRAEGSQSEHHRRSVHDAHPRENLSIVVEAVPERPEPWDGEREDNPEYVRAQQVLV
eukprot:CAMPEP_0170156098 /NCGR_PEP_ID=MMETSP0033_2-20121228/62335_1 /TAXON_ID=195969 /ORGANISM="Dolichomastix tenuilepis, Strain CCMP3274" /LENGTH=152 /DNA_ID=CAMNT_0010393439 /DNA_START=88 /DNA_END=546 /DNA_ORIENTATION=-